MARKPKAAPSNDFANSPEEVLAALSDAPAPARRGRKPKAAAAAAPEPVSTMDSDDAAGGTADADGTLAGPEAPPVRKRPGPKPKGRASAAGAAPLRHSAEATAGREAPAPDATSEPMPAAGGDPGAETDDQASLGSSQNAAPSAQPAAQWDRTSNTVSFDWPAIERTASQDGPNQVMAKLLVAARAEGANSRWPF